MRVRERVVQMMMRRGAYLQNTIQIHVGAIDYKDCPSCKEIVGAIQGQDERLPHGVHRP